MAGYALFNFNNEYTNAISHYFKFGGKLGGRIDFGKSGGFVIEPSIGYYWALGETNIDFLGVFDGVIDDGNFFNQLLNGMYDRLIKELFVGGLQVSLGLGYRF
jgi:hypothetical protein